MSIPAFAVIASYPIFCPDTDAAMGSGSHVVERFPTLGEAVARADELNGEIDWEDFDDETDWSYSAKFRKPHKDEGEIARPRYSMPELQADEWAHRRDAGCPAHML